MGPILGPIFDVFEVTHNDMNGQYWDPIFDHIWTSFGISIKRPTLRYIYDWQHGNGVRCLYLVFRLAIAVDHMVICYGHYLFEEYDLSYLGCDLGTSKYVFCDPYFWVIFWSYLGPYFGHIWGSDLVGVI